MKEEEIKYERGSEWRKWDLHVHTPCSIINSYGGDTPEVWEKFITDLENLPEEVKVLGINDYLFLDGYEKVLEYKKEKERLKNIELILPVLEFRLKEFSGVDFGSYGRPNIHVIFADHTILGIDIIKSQFLNTLDSKYVLEKDDKSFCRSLTKESLSELGNKIIASAPKDKKSDYGSPLKEGFNNLNIALDKIQESLNKDCFERKYLLAIGKTEWSEMKWTDASIADKKTLINSCNIIFTSSKSIENFERSKSQLTNQGVKNLLLDCSDAHHFSDAKDSEGKAIKDRIGKCFTWIKADPTFEGLKQIIYEPADRVEIQANKPEEKNGYQVIDSINISNDICKQTIKLNPNLNTIIGGRSTGKSTLLQTIACKIKNSNFEKVKKEKKHLIDEMMSDTIIKWQDGEENKDRDIEFFSQNYMYDIARSEEDKNQLIEKIVQEKEEEEDNRNLLGNYENFCNSNRSNIQNDTFNLFNLQTQINFLNETLQEKGDKEGLLKEIEGIKCKMTEANKSYQLSKEDIEKLQESEKNIDELKQLSNQLETDKKEIEVLKEQSLFDSSFIYKLNNLSQENRNAVNNIFEKIKKEVKNKWKDEMHKKLEELKNQIDKNNQKILGITNEAFFQKELIYLEQNKQYNELQDRLKNENKKLDEINNTQKKIDNLETQKRGLFQQILQNHLAYFKEINTLIEKFPFSHKDIEIKIEKIFKKVECKEILNNFINLQSHERQDYVYEFIENYEQNPKTKVEEFLTKALKNEFSLTKNKNIQDLSQSLLIENWFSISYQLTYQNDTFGEMSDGKKAFVILKLLLDFSKKKCPILIDQPEDSLDNRAIYNELVNYIKKKKKDRQIILVTHDANVVVNADAEEVIVANQHGKDSINKNQIKFQYISGSLENTEPKEKQEKIILLSQGIKEHVCEILEGGEEAFKSRENKYGFG